MLFSTLVRSNRDLDNALTKETAVLFKAEEPYTISRQINGDNTYNWSADFLSKLDVSILENNTSNMGPRELAVFKAYTKNSIFTNADIRDRAAIALDELLATIE